MKVQDIRLELIDVTMPKFADEQRQAEFDKTISMRAEEIKETILIHPILVRPDGKRFRLIAGTRRFLAVQKNGEKTIPCHVYDGDLDDARLKVSENDLRSSLPLSDQWALMQDLLAEEKEKAKHRRGRKGKHASRDTEKNGRAAEHVAKRFGWSATKLTRVGDIVQAAKEHPEPYAGLLRQMDDTGRYHCAWQRLQDMKQAAAIQATTPATRPDWNRFVHGDALTSLAEMKDGSADFILTDPPFGISKVYGRLVGDQPDVGWTEPGHSPETYWAWFEPFLKEMYRVVRPGGLLAIWQSWQYRRFFHQWYGPYGFDEFFVCKESVDYRKNNRNKRRASVHADLVDEAIQNEHYATPYRKAINRSFLRARTVNAEHACPMIFAIDPVVMMWKQGDRMLLPLNWKGRHRENWLVTDMDIDPVGKQYIYSKPVAACREFIFRWCREGAAILDPFSGSGAIPIAAELEGHPWMGVEMDGRVCDLASKRRAWHLDHEAKPDPNDWSTEDEFWAALHGIFNFAVDACASKANAKLPRFWTKEDNSLRQDWSGETVWCNPPFDDIEPFLRKAKTAKTCCAIVPATALTTRYFREVRPRYIALPDKRIHFHPPTGPRKKTQHAYWGFPLLLYGEITQEQVRALEAERLVVFKDGSVPAEMLVENAA